MGRSLKIGMRTFSKKEKNIISLLFLLSLAFLTNIPMAAIQVMRGFGFSLNLTDFFVALINILELVFAASNFYLYCFCNSKIRAKVTLKECEWKITKLKAAAWLKCWGQWEAKSGDLEARKGEEAKETAMVSTIFPRIFSSLSAKNEKGMH